MQSLQNIMDDIARIYAFTPEHYPVIEGKSAEEVFLFGVRHNALHMAKALGKVSAYSEDVDHGNTGNRDVLQEGTVKMLINVLRLAELQGIRADQLPALIAQAMR